MGDQMYGRCDLCGKEASLVRTYFHYDLKCKCHGPNHFELIDHCMECYPYEPLKTTYIPDNNKKERRTVQTSTLKKLKR